MRFSLLLETHPGGCCTKNIYSMHYHATICCSRSTPKPPPAPAPLAPRGDETVIFAVACRATIQILRQDSSFLTQSSSFLIQTLITSNPSEINPP